MMQVLYKIVKVIFRSRQMKENLWAFYIFVMIKFLPYRFKKLVRKVRKKDKIKIAFMIQMASSWKYDYLFRMLLEDKRFEPIIIICPITNYDSDTMYRELQIANDFFFSQNYPVYSTWDENSQKWIDIKKNLNPDIVFFSNPWAELSRPEYYIYNFLDTLTCYAPYGFKSSHLYNAIFNMPFQNLLWKIFYETEIHKRLAFKYARNKGANGLVTGYPGMDTLLDISYLPKEVWKIKNKTIKRIIWAPHHTIFGKADSNVGFSTFLLYSDFMFRIAEKYKNSIQISFKPHPLLRPKMYNHQDWGKEKTDLYFEKWMYLPNAQLNDSNYIDLFLTSDGLINDGESFMVEYLYTQKPSLFLVADERVSERFNVFGKLVFDQLYKGYNESDIDSFINDVIINGKDYKKEMRIDFFENQVKPPHNKLASDNIYCFIKTTLS
jgi:hypothetical protein